MTDGPAEIKAATDWRDSLITLSFALDKYKNGTNDTYTIHKLVARHFTKHAVHPTKGSGGFSCELVDDAPSVAKENGGKPGKNLTNVNAKSWPVLVYDFDDGQTYADATTKLRDDGVAFVGYSSYSNMQPKEDGTQIEKFRIVVFLTTPYVFPADVVEHGISLDVYTAAYKDVAAYFGFQCDSTGSSAAHLFYLPSHDGSDAAAAHAFIDRAAYESGTPFNFERHATVARVKVAAARVAAEEKKAARDAKKAKKQERAATYETHDLEAFLYHCGADFDVKQFVLDYGDKAGPGDPPAVQAVCPNQDEHTGGADDRLTDQPPLSGPVGMLVHGASVG